MKRPGYKQIGGQIEPDFDAKIRAAATKEGFKSKWGFILWLLTQYIKGNLVLKKKKI